jgi:hypothetical protein
MNASVLAGLLQSFASSSGARPSTGSLARKFFASKHGLQCAKDNNLRISAV